MTRDVERTLIVFAKVPRPGRVKTRLAAAIGDVEAASLYGIMGRRVLDGGCRLGPWMVLVVDATQSLAADVRIDLRRADIRVPQHQLQAPEVRAPLQ